MKAILTIYEEYIQGRTTGREVEKKEFATKKAALAHCEDMRKEQWGELKGKLNWWETDGKKVALPNNGQWRRWATITKV